MSTFSSESPAHNPGREFNAIVAQCARDIFSEWPARRAEENIPPTAVAAEIQVLGRRSDFEQALREHVELRVEAYFAKLARCTSLASKLRKAKELLDELQCTSGSCPAEIEAAAEEVAALDAALAWHNDNDLSEWLPPFYDPIAGEDLVPTFKDLEALRATLEASTMRP